MFTVMVFMLTGMTAVMPVAASAGARPGPPTGTTSGNMVIKDDAAGEGGVPSPETEMPVPPTLPPGTSVPGDMCGDPYFGFWRWVEPGWQPSERRRHEWHANCASGPRRGAWSIYMGGAWSPGGVVCVAPGGSFYAGWKTLNWTHEDGELHSAGMTMGDCTLPSPPDPPEVRVTGQAVVPRRMGENAPMRPMAGARWELWYKGRHGTLSDPEEWHPVRPGAGGTGDPLTGYLGPNGEFDIEFVYPQNYQLANGSMWYGCLPTEPEVDFQQSHACADDKLVLRVEPKNADATVKVSEPGGNGEVEVSDEIELGLFFQRPEDQEHELTSPAAAAYGGILNVRDRTEGALGAALVQLNDEGHNRLSPFTNTIEIDTDFARSSAVEHEAGHLLERRLASAIPDLDPACRSHAFTLPSSDGCGWAEGFADFVAVLAENTPGTTDWTRMVDPGGYHDLEGCYSVFANPDPYRCESGPAVEGRVAAALWDLVDDNPPQEPNIGPTEIKNGFADYSTSSFQEIMRVVDEAEPETFAEFWRGWVDHQSGELRDAETMWLNTLHYSKVFDDDLSSSEGGWKLSDCAPEQCYEAATAWSRPDSGPSWSMTWDITSAVGQDTSASGRWDIWVHIPERENLDPYAHYEVKSSAGVQTYIIDQKTSRGWVGLGTQGFKLGTDGPVTVRLYNGEQPPSEGTSLVADGLLVAPSL
ncbi:hypothetical protein [Acrocarpospora phusangensis]|uniref:hypothetical protein n=1 Tax=Acrocarpospora phusangensis TaxID=1070424 RepID=UPI001950B42E|nr:hypothetical protein [Acrocarpospora phusangensis]